MHDAIKGFYVIYVLLIYSICDFLNSVIYVNEGKNVTQILTYAKAVFKYLAP